MECTVIHLWLLTPSLYALVRRWERAVDLKLNPPKEVKELLDLPTSNPKSCFDW